MISPPDAPVVAGLFVDAGAAVDAVDAVDAVVAVAPLVLLLELHPTATNATAKAPTAKMRRRR